METRVLDTDPKKTNTKTTLDLWEQQGEGLGKCDDSAATLPMPQAEAEDFAFDEKLLTQNLPERYLTVEPLGFGGVGMVQKSLDPNLGRHVALKFLQRDFEENQVMRARFIREARVMSQLEHPNIVPVHELGIRYDNSVYFTMKLVRGESLKEILSNLDRQDKIYQEKYPLAELLDIFEHVVQGVAFAHSRGVVHRDLKPENIMIGEFGEVQIMDWGLVKILASTDSKLQSEIDRQRISLGETSGAVTMQGQISGTPAYMSPEQADGDNEKVGQRSDIYSLGAILYHILTLKNYVEGADVDEILLRVREEIPISPRHRTPERRISRELDAICMKALKKRPEDRYQTVLDLHDDLEAAARGKPVSAYRPGPLRCFWKACRRHPVVSTSSLVGLLVLVSLFGAVLVSRNMRYNRLLDVAREHREMGTEAFVKMQAVSNKLRQTYGRHRGKRRSEDELTLSRSLARYHKQAMTHFQVTHSIYVLTLQTTRPLWKEILALFGFEVPVIRSPQYTRQNRKTLFVFREIGKVIHNEIKCSMLVGNREEAKMRLALLDTFFQEDSQWNMEDLSWYSELKKELSGYGKLEISSPNPDVFVKIYSLRDENGRRMREEKVWQQGELPLKIFNLPHGAYLIVGGKGEGSTGFRLTVRVGPQYPQKIVFDPPSRIPSGTVFVPPGTAVVGGDDSPIYRQQKIDFPGFFLARREVTFGEFQQFWRSLKSDEERGKYIPYFQVSSGALCRGPALDKDGALFPPLRPEMPVVGISVEAAEAYCRWFGDKLGREVRLPTADEWERAARGGDGRRFPWGDGFAKEYAYTAENVAAIARFSGLYAPPGSFPDDCSPQGVFDLAGGVREWTSTPFSVYSAKRQIKGASLATGRRFACAAYASDGMMIPSDVGFRYLIPRLPSD